MTPKSGDIKEDSHLSCLRYNDSRSLIANSDRLGTTLTPTCGVF